MGEASRKILLVGHCTPDNFAMRMALGRYAPGVEFVAVHDTAGLRAHAGAVGLLVNRKLDGDFGTGSGLELLAGLDAGVRARSALISNLADAQAEAQELGAIAGFGKSEMYSDRAKGCIEAMLGAG